MAALASLPLILLIITPSSGFAQGNEFFRCTDREGNVTITNRHYDQRTYECRPFSTLNKAFRDAESRKRQQPQAPQALSTEAGGMSAAEASHMAAASARVSMEAAQASAEAAHITAEAVQRLLARHYFIVFPSTPRYFYDP